MSAAIEREDISCYAIIATEERFTSPIRLKT